MITNLTYPGSQFRQPHRNTHKLKRAHRAGVQVYKMALVRIIQPTSCIKDHGALHRRADELDGFGRHVLVELGKARQPTCLAGSDPSASGPGRARWHHELKALQQDKLPNDDAAHDAATKITRLLERGRNRLCKSSAPERRKAGKP